MSDYWSKTGELFGKLIEKPKMHEKLLKKPPPKYIYDIVMNTMKKTGFPKGIFTPQEEDPKYFEKDARHKLDILQKVIDITKIVTNENFEIKCSNILKGEEPNKTNYFLQKFYEAATNGNDNSKFIQKYLDHKNKKKDDKGKEEKNDKTDTKKEKKVEKNDTNDKNENKKKPTGLISENAKDDDFDNNNKNDNLASEVKLKSGTGMKLDKHIFRHDDIMDDKKEKKNLVSNVDLDAIKNYVQEITKNCNPIGKIIEFIGDDIDGMNKELQNWINESKSYKDRYEDEIKKSDETLLPLQNELLELEDSIRDEQMQIKSIKSRLIKNEKIIQNLITNVISFKGDGQ